MSMNKDLTDSIHAGYIKKNIYEANSFSRIENLIQLYRLKVLAPAILSYSS